MHRHDTVHHDAHVVDHLARVELVHQQYVVLYVLDYEYVLLAGVLPSVLREEPQYRLLFGSQVLSVLGDRVTSVALPFAVLSVGGDVGDVALTSTAQFLPFVLLAVPAGVWADRWDRKRILISSDVVRLVTQAVAATLLLSGNAEVAHLAVLAAVFGSADAFFAPAFSGLLPTTVSPGNLQPANALRGLSFSLANVAGPVVAGVLIGFAGGPGAALVFDAATFLVSVVLLLPLRSTRRGRGRGRGRAAARVVRHLPA